MRAMTLHWLNDHEGGAILAPLRVMVVDDDADRRELIADRLREDGAEVLEVADAIQAFEAIGKGLIEKPMRYFDLVLAATALNSAAASSCRGRCNRPTIQCQWCCSTGISTERLGRDRARPGSW